MTYYLFDYCCHYGHNMCFHFVCYFYYSCFCSYLIIYIERKFVNGFIILLLLIVTIFAVTDYLAFFQNESRLSFCFILFFVNFINILLIMFSIFLWYSSFTMQALIHKFYLQFLYFLVPRLCALIFYLHLILQEL